jgi:hypothetical protein
MVESVELPSFPTRTAHFGRMSGGPPISKLTPQQLRARALEYRAMAGTASTAAIMNALIHLAAGFEALAADREMRRRA